MTRRRTVFPLRSPVGSFWPAIPNSENSRTWAAYLELDRTQWLPANEIERGQMAQLRLLLEHAVQHVPHYRKVLAERKIQPSDFRSLTDLSQLPLLTRNELLAAPTKFRAEVLPGSTRPDLPKLPPTLPIWRLATHLRHSDWCSIDLSGRLATIRAMGGSGPQAEKLLQGIEQPYWSRELDRVVRSGPCFVIDARQDPARQLDWLRNVRPDYLLADPDDLLRLGEQLSHSGKLLTTLRSILITAESLTSASREAIESVFGVRIIDSYQLPELGLIATPCPTRPGYHLHAENVIVELLTADGSPCCSEEGGSEEVGRVVVTGLRDFGLPLIRFETPHRARWGQCSCGRGVPVLSWIGKAHPEASSSTVTESSALRTLDLGHRARGASFFRVRTHPDSLWPVLPPEPSCGIWSAYLELGRTQWLDGEAIVRGQLAQMRTLLRHCYENVPFYRKRLHDAEIDPDTVFTMTDFRAIPTLARRDYQANFEQIQAVALPPTMRKTSVVHTSGTSGVPVEVWQTNLVNQWWLAFYLRDADWSQFDHTGRLAVIRASGKTGTELEALMKGVVSPTWNPQLHPWLLSGECHGMDIHQTPERQLAWLRRVDPDVLQSFPSNLEHLAGLLAESRELLPRLQRILAFAETLTDEVKSRIEAAFGVPVFNCYSCFEAGALASPCPEGHGLHVHSENVILEVLDDSGRPCGPGETGRVVITTLHNFLTPLIRYEILDEATVGPAVCPCSRGLPLLSRVLGRRHPLLTLPDGRKKISTALVVGVRRLDICHQYQIVQKAPDHLVFRIVPNRQGFEANLLPQLKQLAKEFFETDIRVEVETFEQIPLTSRGKLRVVVVEDP